MRFFFDRCAPIAVARMVRAFEEQKSGITILHHDDDSRFTQKTTDVEWMTALADDGEPRWIIDSGDGRILRNKVERAVLSSVGLTFFCLDKQWPNTPIEDYAWKFMKVWPKIVETAKAGQGTVYRVAAGAGLRIEMLS